MSEALSIARGDAECNVYDASVRRITLKFE